MYVHLLFFYVYPFEYSCEILASILIIFLEEVFFMQFLHFVAQDVRTQNGVEMTQSFN